MKKILLFLSAMLLSVNVYAKEIGGLTVVDSTQLGGKTLFLNGAGIRSKMMFDIYVVALYLGEKTKKSDVVIADVNNKRVALHILFGLKSETLLEAFKKAIEANHSEVQLVAMDGQLRKFYAIFNTIPEVKKGDVILLDYLAGVGTKVSINGTERGVVEGVEVNRALLKIWLGGKPVDDDLKKELLGVW